MTDDWAADEGLSREETLARFRALGPKETRGPGTRESVRPPQGVFSGRDTIVGSTAYEPVITIRAAVPAVMPGSVDTSKRVPVTA